MPQQFKTSFIFAASLIFLSSLINTLSAQQVKKTTTPQKRTVVATKKTTTTKTTAIAKKPPVAKTKTTVVKKTNPVKTTSTKALPAAELKMSSRENQMVDEINLVRSDPPGYIKYVKEFIKRTNPGKRTVATANELMDELKKQQPLSPLKINMDMYRDAKDYGKLMMENNSIEHSDLPYNENLSFGIEDIREVIMDLLIDEDIPDRGHRRNILKKNISAVAVHELPGTVEGYHFCYIQEFK